MMGAFTGFFTFGLAHFAIFFFPMVMAVSMSAVARWDWMPPLREGGKSRRGLGLLFLAPFSYILLAPPFVSMLLIPWFVILTPFLAFYHPAWHSSPYGEGPFFDLAFVTVLAIYYWLLGRSLKRFAGSWHRWLFVRLIAWISGIVAVEIVLARHLNVGFPAAPMYSANNFWLFVVWILSMLALSRAGASFGLWLAHPN